jgi:uncharacterized protein
MTRAFTRLAYTASVRAAQQRNGARDHSERMAERPPERDSLPEEMQARIANATSVIIGTASLEGWPHLQHRGGPRGFIKVLGAAVAGVRRLRRQPAIHHCRQPDGK